MKIVKGMVDMVDIKEGDEICDPACGVGKFLLEAALKIDEPFAFENGHVTKKLNSMDMKKKWMRKDQQVAMTLPLFWPRQIP